MTTQQPTVTILYGLGEGPRIGKKLRAALQAAGFKYVNETTKADIIIAHSGGILAIPPNTTHKTILLVAPITGWKGPLIPTQIQKVRQDYGAAKVARRLRQWYIKSLLNTGYLLKHAPTYPKLWRTAHMRRHLLPVLQDCRVGVIVCKDDPWSGFLGTYQFHHQLPYAFISFQRLHDDIWDQPHDYVRIASYLYGYALSAS